MLPNIISRQKTTPCSNSDQAAKPDRLYCYAKLLAEENNRLQPIDLFAPVTQKPVAIRENRKSKQVVEQTGQNNPHLSPYYQPLSEEYIQTTIGKAQRSSTTAQSFFAK